MAHSSLLGIDRPPTRPNGTDADLLGPSDSSDTGSDMTGISELDATDPAMPVDRALDDDRQRPITPVESLAPGGDSDMQGTGERRSAAGDGPRGEAPDISPDRIEGAVDGAIDDDQQLSDTLDDQFADAMEEDDED